MLMAQFLRGIAIVLLAIVAFFAAAVLWPASKAPVAALLADHAITNVHLVDVRSGTASAPTNIVIRDGKIAGIGADVPAGLSRIDGKGGYLIPGLWDMHSHSWQLSPQMHFPLQLANGVVAVRDMMDCPEATDSLIACIDDKRRWNRRAESGRLAAPRFVGIGSFYFEAPDMSPARARSLVRDYKRRGIDYIKVYNRLPAETYAAVTDEARKIGMPVVGHLPKAVTLADALSQGQRGFDHAHVLVRACSARGDDWGGKLDALSPTARDKLLIETFDPGRCADLLGQMRKRNVWFVPTHVTREEDARAGDPSFADDPRLGYADPLSRWSFGDDLGGTRAAYPGRDGERVLKDYFEHGLKLTGAAHRAGVRVLAGTDTIIGGFKIHDELEHLVRAGLSPAEALRAATLHSAEAAGRENESGAIDQGKRADLVLLRANPLERIGNTRAIEAVFLGGRYYDRVRLDALLDFTKGQAGTPANWAKALWGFAMSSVNSSM